MVYNNTIGFDHLINGIIIPVHLFLIGGDFGQASATNGNEHGGLPLAVFDRDHRMGIQF